MRIFVVSDTHGDLKNAIELYDRALKGGPIDFIIHCGDFLSDGVRLGEVLGQKIYAVHGNCDGGWGEEFEIAQTPAGKILVIHGHNEDVGFSLLSASYLAQQEGCSAVCYGHTHRSRVEDYNGILFVNPGSTRRPREMGSKGSAAVMTADERGFAATILYL